MSDKKFTVIMAIIFVPYLTVSAIGHIATIDEIELLELQIEEKQLRIKQIKSGACIGE